MQQRITRVTGAGGLDLACATVGAGQPLLYVNGWLSHLELGWELARERMGCTNQQIATKLGIELRSAEGHVERIRVRLGFRSRAQIAAWYAAEHDRAD